MKKLMFVFLLVIPFCKAADPYESWNRAIQNVNMERDWVDLSEKQIAAIPNKLNYPDIHVLVLDRNLLGALPDNLDFLPALEVLNVDDNQIAAIDNLNHPSLFWLTLNSNRITYVNIDIFDRLPGLVYLELKGNYLTKSNVKDLEQRARELKKTERKEIFIEAQDQSLPAGITIKGAHSQIR